MVTFEENGVKIGANVGDVVNVVAVVSAVNAVKPVV